MNQQESGERTVLVNELETSLTRLESALVDAGRAISSIRGCIPQISALIEVVNTMETAMTFARERLGAGTAPQAAPLRAIPPQEPAPQPEPAAEPVPSEPPTPSQFCLRLRVGSKAGSLDLKAVDSAVNEQSAVTDVALIDYDGRQATLRVWITATSSDNVREALHQSLRSRLGGEEVADVEIEFEEQAAA
jgi:hypothetical protein